MFNDGQDDITLEENDLENHFEASSRDLHLEVRKRQRRQKRRHRRRPMKDEEQQ